MANFTPEEISQFLAEFFDVVGKRQYVGARYVPIFGRKDETTIAWDNSAPYEPLTIVLYQGNSYTSRQYVPTGVDISDTDYWALTANYNSQVEQYRQEVIELREDYAQYKIDTDADIAQYKTDTNADIAEWKDAALDTITDALSAVPRIGIFIGNSYTDGVGEVGHPNGMFNMLKYLFNEAYKFTTGGNGFSTYSDHTTDFYTQLQSAAADDSFENELVTDIIFTSAMGDTRAICEGYESTLTANAQTLSTWLARTITKSDEKART